MQQQHMRAIKARCRFGQGVATRSVQRSTSFFHPACPSWIGKAVKFRLSNQAREHLLRNAGSERVNMKARRR